MVQLDNYIKVKLCYINKCWCIKKSDKKYSRTVIFDVVSVPPMKVEIEKRQDESVVGGHDTRVNKSFYFCGLLSFFL